MDHDTDRGCLGDFETSLTDKKSTFDYGSIFIEPDDFTGASQSHGVDKIDLGCYSRWESCLDTHSLLRMVTIALESKEIFQTSGSMFGDSVMRIRPSVLLHISVSEIVPKCLTSAKDLLGPFFLIGEHSFLPNHALIKIRKSSGSW